MAAPHQATVFYSHDEANADNRRTVEFNEDGTRSEFDAAVCMALMGTKDAGPGKLLRFEGVMDGAPGGKRFKMADDECPMDTDWVAVFVEDAPGAESMPSASGALNAHIQGAHRGSARAGVPEGFVVGMGLGAGFVHLKTSAIHVEVPSGYSINVDTDAFRGAVRASFVNADESLGKDMPEEAGVAVYVDMRRVLNTADLVAAVEARRQNPPPVSADHNGPPPPEVAVVVLPRRLSQEQQDASCCYCENDTVR